MHGRVSDDLNRRIQSAVWGTAAASTLMLTWVLPWAHTPGTVNGPGVDFTLWQLSEGSYGPTDLPTVVRLLLALMLITVLALLRAAASPSVVSSLIAGLAAAFTTAEEIYIRTRIELVIGPLSAVVVAATVLTTGIAVAHLVMGTFWARRGAGN